MTASRQPTTLGQYLARRGFAPNPGNPAWLDLRTRQQIVRVLHEPGETTFLYCLDPHGGCLYEARFTPGTPDAVIIATLEAALNPTLGPTPVSAGVRQATGQQHPRAKRSGHRDHDR